MSTKDIKALERRIFDEFNKGKAAAMKAIDEMCSANIVWHDVGGREIRGLKDFKKSMSELYDAFPDTHFAIDDMFAEGDKVAVRYKVTGTHKGEYMGIPPTNKKVTIWAIEIDRIVGGKAAEGWLMFDTLSFMQQLGVIPAPEKK